MPREWIFSFGVKPRTFWNSITPHEYGFTANVDPKVPHPRWSQETERLIDTGERRKTLSYNGYGESVAGLYSSASFDTSSRFRRSKFQV